MSHWLQSLKARQAVQHRQAALGQPSPELPAPALTVDPHPPISGPPAPPPPPQQFVIDWMDILREHIYRGRTPTGTVQEEVARILSLPVLLPGLQRCPNPEEYERSLVLPSCRDFSLRPVQIDGIWTFEAYGGLLAPIGVGWGKTLIAMLSAVRAIRSRGHYRVVIMVPPEVFGQFVKRDLPWARQRCDFQGVAFRPVTGSAAQRREITNKSGSGVWIYSYSSLSTKTGYDELKSINASCYILDEAHNLANAKATRTKRWHSIMAEQSDVVEHTHRLVGFKAMKSIECIALSGTVTKKSVMDYAHLATRCLGQLSPVPTRESPIHAIGNVIDAESLGGFLASNDLDSAVVQQYIDWARMYDIPLVNDQSDIELTKQEMIRIAYRNRLNRSAGVIATSDQGVESSLIVGWVEPQWPNAPEMVQMVELMKKIVNDQRTPNGDVIDYAMHQFKWLWELSAGFYNQLVWPTLDEVIQQYPLKWGRTISLDEAEALLEQAYKHHQLLQQYHQKLRQFLDHNHIPGCDSPMLVAQEIVHQHEGHNPRFVLPFDLIKAYLDQRNEGRHTYPDLPERYSTPVRVCDYKIQAAADLAQSYHKEGAFIWYHHPDVGLWLHEELTRRGFPHHFAPAGANEVPYEEGVVITSFSHGTGKNLQHKNRNVFLEVRREAYVMEQAIGRTHRSGQSADEVHVEVLLANGFDLSLFGGILRDADYIQSTTGQQQRLCYATYDPVIPPTDPRLMRKLGIIKHHVESSMTSEWGQITPPDIEDIATVFRPIAYGKSHP